MEGRWLIEGTPDGDMLTVARGDRIAPGEAVPVVPCDDAAIERAMQAIIDSDDIIPHGEEPERIGWALALAERALRAAGETP